MSDRVETSRLWEICRTLVRHDTVPERTNVPLAEWIADRLDAAGWTVRLIRDHALGAAKATVVAWTGPAAPGGLMLSGHMDIVPWESQPGWTRDALELGRDDARMYGRGVADMKGFLAASLDVAERVDPATLSRPVVLLFTCDEEPGCLGIERQLRAIAETMAGVPMPMEAVIGEPTSMRVFGAHRGHVRVPVTLRGRAGHSSRPDLGVNAIVAAAAAIRAVERFSKETCAAVEEEAARLYPDYPSIPVNVGTIRGGCAINMIPEECSFSLGFRPSAVAQVEPLIEELRARILRAVGEGYPEAGLEFGEVIVTPPLEPGPVGAVGRVLRELSGSAEFLGAPYATDGAYLRQLGITCYLWGPGELEQAHQPDESLPIEAFVRLPAQLEALVRRVCG